MRIEQKEIPQIRQQKRPSLEESLKKLYSQYRQDLKCAKAYRIWRGKPQEVPIFGQNTIIDGDNNVELDKEEGIGKAISNMTANRNQYLRRIEKSNEMIIEALDMTEQASDQIIEETQQVNEYAGSENQLDEKVRRWDHILREITYKVLLRNEKLKSVLLHIIIRDKPEFDAESEVDVAYLEAFLKNLNSSIENKFISRQWGIEPAGNDKEKYVSNIHRWQTLEDQRRYTILQSLSQDYHIVSEFIYAIAEQFRHIRPYMDTVVGELNKEPIVHSEFKVSEDGSGYVDVIYNVFTLYLERRFEVLHKLNRAIQERFSFEGISVLSVEEMKIAESRKENTLPA